MKQTTNLNLLYYIIFYELYVCLHAYVLGGI